MRIYSSHSQDYEDAMKVKMPNLTEEQRKEAVNLLFGVFHSEKWQSTLGSTATASQNPLLEDGNSTLSPVPAPTTPSEVLDEPPVAETPKTESTVQSLPSGPSLVPGATGASEHEFFTFLEYEGLSLHYMDSLQYPAPSVYRAECSSH